MWWVRLVIIEREVSSRMVLVVSVKVSGCFWIGYSKVVFMKLGD